MEVFVTLLIPVLAAIVALRLMLLPMRLLLRVGIHAAGGFFCLWLLNAISGFTGILFPLNAVTVSAAGFLGIPGIGLLAVLAVMG